MDFPLYGEFEAVNAGADYVGDAEGSESFGSEFGVRMREAKVCSFQPY